MTFRRTVASVVAIASTSAVLAAQAARTDAMANLKTRAEATNFTETSRYDDIESFLDTVDRASPLVHVTSFGYSFEGRRLLLAIAGSSTDVTPDAIKKSGRLRVYIQANIHAGEVEGKEAVLALVRDIARGSHAAWMKSMVLLVNPNYNADGNERVSHGVGQVGGRRASHRRGLVSRADVAAAGAPGVLSAGAARTMVWRPGTCSTSRSRNRTTRSFARETDGAAAGASVRLADFSHSARAQEGLDGQRTRPN